MATETAAVFFTTLVVLACTTPFTYAENLRCFKCDHNEVSTNNNAVVKWILQTLSKVDHPGCKMENEGDKYNVDVRECPSAADSGRIYVCGTARGTVTATFAGVSFKLETTARDCVQVPSDDAAYSGCHDTNTVSGPLRFLLEEAVSAVKDVDLSSDASFSGSTCYDHKGSRNLGVPSRGAQLQCVTCSRNEVVSDNSVLGPVLSLFSQISNDACLMERADDAHSVTSRICPDPARGEDAICAVVKGDADTSFLGISFTYKTVERGCFERSSSETQVSPGQCTTDVPASGFFKSFIKQGLQDLNLGDVKFSGLVCYSESGYGTVTAEGLVGRTAPTQSVSVWALVCCSLSCMLLAALV